jgi:hypothetical protein
VQEEEQSRNEPKPQGKRSFVRVPKGEEEEEARELQRFDRLDRFDRFDRFDSGLRKQVVEASEVKVDKGGFVIRNVEHRFPIVAKHELEFLVGVVVRRHCCLSFEELLMQKIGSRRLLFYRQFLDSV